MWRINEKQKYVGKLEKEYQKAYVEAFRIALSSVREKLKSIDPLNITPIEAINILYELKKHLNK